MIIKIIIKGEKMVVSKSHLHIGAIEIYKYLYLEIWTGITGRKLSMMRYHNTVLVTLLHMYGALS